MGQEPPPPPRRIIKAVLFDLDGTLLDTEALSDKAILQVYFDKKLISPSILAEHNNDAEAQHGGGGYRLPWELKKQILGLRGSDWGPIVIEYAIER